MNAWRSLLCVVLGGLLVAGLNVRSARGADDPPNLDDNQPELTPDQKKFEATQHKPMHYRGKLVTVTPKEIADSGDSSVFAKLVSDETMFVKTSDAKVKALLIKELGKDVTVNGHRWTDGKFINVIGLVPQLDASATVRPPGGF